MSRRSRKPVIGAMAWHVDGLDPREVVDVDRAGRRVRLNILGIATDWLPAENYTYQGGDGGIRGDLAQMDEAGETYSEAQESDGGESVKDYENYEDSRLGFADTAENWIRRALEVLSPSQIQKVDDAVARQQYARIMTPSQPGTAE